jgi:hypothetical protein
VGWREKPTAVHAVREPHDTAVQLPMVGVTAGSIDDSIDHLAPFQRSTRIAVVPEK